MCFISNKIMLSKPMFATFKLLFLLSITCFWGLSATAQQQDLQKLITGKRWGLSLFIQKNGNLYDTIFRVRDCQNEFIEITNDGKFLSTDLNKEGKWQIEGKQLVLKKQGNWHYKTLEIAYISEDSLALFDYGKGKNQDIFIETYKICGLEDKTFLDTREIKTVRKSWGLVGGVQQFNNTYAVLGVAKAKFEWNNVFYAAGILTELAPWHEHYGLNLNFWSEDILVYGASVVGFTNFSKMAVGFRPMLGFSTARLTHKNNFTLHLTYSYTLLFSEDKWDKINRHAIALRMYIPTFGSKKEVRKIIRTGTEY
jgi:hypothetical protein